jgi:hypothetical protein
VNNGSTTQIVKKIIAGKIKMYPHMALRERSRMCHFFLGEIVWVNVVIILSFGPFFFSLPDIHPAESFQGNRNDY